jgi:hypothetical protein
MSSQGLGRIGHAAKVHSIVVFSEELPPRLSGQSITASLQTATQIFKAIQTLGFLDVLTMDKVLEAPIS